MVLLEAMYFGAPVVSSRNGGSLTLMQDGSCGQIVDKFDVKLWCEAILKYLDNPEYAEKISQEAKRKIREEYTWDVITDKMLKTAGLSNQEEK